MDFANYWFSSAAGGGGYEIDNSLRFRGTQYLSWTPAAAGNRKTWTWSGWVKRARVSHTEEDVFGVAWPAGGVPSNSVRFSNSNNDDQIPRFSVYMGSGQSYGCTSPGVARDPAAWMHFVAVWDTTNATQSERIRFFINGVQQPNTSTNALSLDTEGPFNTTTEHRFSGGVTYGRLFSGYVAETHFVDGTALDPTSFGEYNADGVWVPKEVSGVTYGANGFYLDFSDPANIGADRSGNGNNFTPTGFELTSTTSTSYDWMADSPTNNYNTLNPLVSPYWGNTTLEKANLYKTTSSNGNGVVDGTLLVRGGKWYWEAVMTGSDDGAVGISQPPGGYGYVGDQLNTYGYMDSGEKAASATYATYGTAWGRNDLIGTAFDADAGTLEFFVNGVSQGVAFTGIPDAGFAAAVSGFASTRGNDFDVNYGNRPFQYTPPAGFEPLSTAGLPDADITNPGEHFGVITYTGNGASTRTITGLSFQPDLVWIKNYGAASDHMWFDSVRGTNKILKTVGVGPEETDNNALTSFNSNGFTLGTSTNGNPTNANGGTYVAYCFKKGPSSGFDIVAYTGTGSDQLLNHSLGVVPAFATVKCRTGGSRSWWAWHKEFGNNYNANNSMIEFSGSGPLYSDDVFDGFTSTQFRVGTDPDSNASSSTYVMYLWAEIPGFSSMGKYIGNASSDGPFVYCGFRPAYVLLKPYSGTTDYWFIYDKERDPYNLSYHYHNVDRSVAQNTDPTNASIDMLSNGFKLRHSGTNTNGNGNTYLYVAFAEHPFGGGNVAPSPAR